VRRYLVVANQTLGGDSLVQAIRERMLHEPAQFWVLVPATSAANWARNASGSMPSLDTADMASSDVSLAQQQLDTELQRLHESGADADGEVGDADPVKAIANTLRRQEFDEIILSTLPRERSRWLRQDLPEQVRRKFRLPVTHIVTAYSHW
jgi:hypothetical protein